jgi:hypothetical protein
MRVRNRPIGFVNLSACAVLLLAVPAFAAAAGQDDKTGRHQPQTSSSVPGSARAVNVNTIDPATFHAIATRLPKGQAPKIDGRLDDEVWTLAEPAGNFIQREPHAGLPATERTEFRILYDDRRIYFGVWALDSDAGGIQASELKRDSGLTKGDRVAIVIDTFHDRRNGFYFATNPLGAYKDAQYTDNARVRNNDWNAVWTCRTSTDDKGWYAEIAIPLSQLRFRKSVGETTWGLNVARSIIRKHEDTYWVPYPREQGANGFAYLSNAGVLDGLRDLPAPRRLELVPFVAPQVGRDYSTDTSTTKADRYGFDARAGLTETLMADLTYRTDFAQVEADQEVVNVSRFSLFFPEKRGFFTESAGLFNYGKPGVETGDFGPGLLPLFYSRQIGLHDGREVPIVAGGRVTGRVGPYSVGLLNVETDATSWPSGSQRVDVARANYSVARVKRDILAHSSVGAILLNRQGGPGAAYSRTAGFDVNLVLRGDARLTALVARTFTPRAVGAAQPGSTTSPEAGSAGSSQGGEWAAAVDFAYQKDRYNYDVTYLDVGPNFTDDMGYIQRTDIRNPRVRAAWTPRPDWRGVRQLSVGGLTQLWATHAGRTESRNSDGQFAVTFTDTSVVTLDVLRDYDLLTAPWTLGASAVAPGGYSWNTARIAYTSNPRLRVTGNAEVETGSYYNGDKTTWTGGLSLLPLETLLVEVLYNRNRITQPYAAPLVTNTLSTRVSYSFSPTLFAKAFVQYNDDKKLASLNLLLWGIYRPGSDLYVVYNQGWNTDLPGPHFMQIRNRSLALKMTYWLSR